MKHSIHILITILALSGCAVNTITRTNDLAPGMSAAEVRKVMGAPSQTQFVADRIVWKYSLHQPWVGYVPYYVVFDGSQHLQSWYADQAEFARQQAMWLAATPTQVNVHEDVNLNVQTNKSPR